MVQSGVPALLLDDGSGERSSVLDEGGGGKDESMKTDKGESGGDGEDEDALRACIAAMGDALTRRDDAYERDHAGAKSCRELIAADPQWEHLYQRLKRAEMRLARLHRKPGGCAHYIARRRRYCASRAGDGLGGLCSLHAPELGSNPSAPKQHQLQHQQHAGGREVGAADARNGLGGPDGTIQNGAVQQQQQQQTSSRKTNIHRRMKKMTNPMAAPFRVPVPAPDWSAVFADCTLPMLIDVGCAKGRFLQRSATTDADLFEARHGRHNLLGLEIYEPLVTEANLWRKEQRRPRGGGGGGGGDSSVAAAGAVTGGGGGESGSGSGEELQPVANLHFIACNANVSLPGMNLPNLKVVTVLFPDPWSRRRQGCHSRVSDWLSGTILAVINWCFDCKIT
jgi:tRNA (guanine-N7-)-methyltransferase